MRKNAVLLGLLAVTVCWGQWIEATVWLPDSLNHLDDPTFVYQNPVTNRMYFSGPESEGVHIYDPNSRTKTGFYGDAVVDAGFLHVPELNRIYGWSISEYVIMVFDDHADTLIEVRTDYEPWDMVHSPQEGKLYLLDDLDYIMIFDAGPDTWLKTVFTTGSAWKMVWDSVANRMFVMNHSEYEPDRAVSVFSCAGDSFVAHLPGSNWYTFDIAFFPERSRLYCVGIDTAYDYWLWVYDTDSLAVVGQHPLPVDWGRGPVQVLLNPQSEFLYIGYREEFLDSLDDAGDSIVMYDCSRDTVVDVLALPDEVWLRGFCLNRTQNKVYLWTEDHDVGVMAEPDSMTNWLVFPSTVIGLGWNPVDDELYVPCRNDSVYILNGAADTIVGHINYGRLQARDLVWNPTGKLYFINDDGIGYLDRNLGIAAWQWLDLLSMTEPTYVQELDRIYLFLYDTLLVYSCAADSVVAGTALPLLSWGTPLVLEDAHTMLVAGSDNQTMLFDYYADSVVACRSVLNHRFAYNPRNGLAYGWSSNLGHGLVAFDPATLEVVESLPFRQVMGLGVNTTDNEVWFNTADSLLYVLDGETHVLVDTLDVPGSVEMYGLTWVAPENKVYLHGTNRTYVFDCPSRSYRGAVEHGLDWYPSIKDFYNPRNNKLYLVGEKRATARDTVIVLSCRTDSVVAGFRLPSDRLDVAWNPAENMVYVSAGNFVIVLQDEMTGIEGPVVPREAKRLTPTIVHSALLYQHAKSAVLLDIMGREVMDLRPGDNDIRHIAPGVYFVRSADSGGRSAVSVRKVVIQR